VGLDVSHHTHVSPEGRGKYFFLDILFHRMSDNGIYQQSGQNRRRIKRFQEVPKGEFPSVAS
jgi:hypothetical protein